MSPRARLAAADKLELAEHIASVHDVTIEMMWSSKRSYDAVSCARHHFWAELYDSGNWSYPRIAQLVDRNHSTVLLGIRAHHKRQGTEAA